MSAQDWFDRLPHTLIPDKAAGVNATVQYELSGDGGGVWSVTVADSKCTVHEAPSDNPNLVFYMDAHDFEAMIAGELQPMRAFMEGKIRLQGDMGLAMKFQEMFYM